MANRPLASVAGGESMSLILLFLAWGGLFFGVGIWIVRPVDRAARQRRQRVRYSLTDFLCLFVIVQAPLTAMAWLRANAYISDGEPVWLFAAMAWILGPLIWWTATRAISRAGVYHGWPRVVFMGLVVPTVYFGLMVLFAFVIELWAVLASDGELEFVPSARSALTLTVLLGCALWVAGIVTRQIVRRWYP